MSDFLSFVYHAWFQGHSVEVMKYQTALATRSARRGWFYQCDCGKTWAR